jgi:hypothetical protein
MSDTLIVLHTAIAILTIVLLIVVVKVGRAPADAPARDFHRLLREVRAAPGLPHRRKGLGRRTHAPSYGLPLPALPRDGRAEGAQDGGGEATAPQKGVTLTFSKRALRCSYRSTKRAGVLARWRFYEELGTKRQCTENAHLGMHQGPVCPSMQEEE